MGSAPRIVAAALALGLAAAACSGGDDDATSTSTTAADASDSGTELAAGKDGPVDICDLVAIEDVTRIAGEEMKASEGNTPEQCGFESAVPDVDFTVVLVSGFEVAKVGDLKTFAETASAQAAAFSGGETDMEDLKAADGGRADKVDGVGDEAYASGEPGAQMLHVRYGDVIATFSFSGPGGMSLDKAVALATAVGARI